MAAFNISITIGASTRTLSGTVSAGDATRFVAALHLCFPNAATDNDVVDAWLAKVRAQAVALVRYQEQTAAENNVTTIGIT